MTSKAPDRDWLHRAVIPITYIQIELLIAEERGLNPLLLAEEAGIHKEILANPAGLVSPLSHAWLMFLIIERTGNNGLGFEVGLRLPPTAHGNLGYAMLSCGSLRQALLLLERFWYLRERGAHIQLFEQDELAIVELKTEALFPAILRPVFFDCLLATIYRLIQLLLGDMSQLGEFWLDYPEPEYYSLFKDRLPPVHYNMPAIQGRIPIAVLDRPLIMSNPEALKQAIAQCKRESALQGIEQDDFLNIVREQFNLTHGYPTPEILAERLHISIRTLRRRLQDEGTGYKFLLENARRRDSVHLLNNPDIEIQKVAELLGYVNPTNFTRAFRQWTGKTPREYRALRQPLIKSHK